jgi:hypothetical protein
MMFLVAKLPFPRGSGSHSLKQWAAGAPVIGAAAVSSARPKRPRSEGLSGSGALQLFLWYRRLRPPVLTAKVRESRKELREERLFKSKRRTKYIKRDNPDARNINPFGASEILAHGLRVYQHHAPLRLRELRTVALTHRPFPTTSSPRLSFDSTVHGPVRVSPRYRSENLEAAPARAAS